MLPFSSHARFFSSLKQVKQNPTLPVHPPLQFCAHLLSLSQVEERLASEDSPPNKTPKPEASSSIDPSGSPIFLAYPQSNLRDSDSGSGPARDFLSSSSSSSSSEEKGGEDHADQKEQECDTGDEDDDDEIEHLMNLLDVEVDVEGAGEAAESCGECEFYAKVGGVRGPKCEKERQRLEGWVEHFYRGWRGAGRREPARLAHLLLAKASCSADGCGGIGFPDTVEEFLEHDPVLATAVPAGKEGE
uniref:Uncharacterized protein n=1 Tax=Ananas comosus var. bracteatus TaxID=296719 RepID=A0A6V7QHB3_ANACO|nr:unnamed protein product [Ananas comosus var. bracteatus]